MVTMLLNRRSHPREVNIAVLGQRGVGKSALTVKYKTKRFIGEYDPQLEGIFVKSDCISGQEFIIKIMDTNDSESKRAERYLEWANAFVVVYSITDLTSFRLAQDFLAEIQEYCTKTQKQIPTMLIGNKSDLVKYRLVSQLMASNVSSKYDCRFCETSAADDLDSVTSAFQQLVNDIKHQSERVTSLQPLYITEDKPNAPHNHISPTRPNFLRAKSPKVTTSSRSVSSSSDEQNKNKNLTSRPSTATRIFNSFKIFN